MKELLSNFWKADERHAFTGWEAKLYFYIVKLIGESEDGTFIASDPKLAANVGMSINTFKPCRKRLLDAKLISIVEGGKGYGQKTSYSAYVVAKPQKPKPEKEKSPWQLAVQLNRPWPFSQVDFDDAWIKWCRHSEEKGIKPPTTLGFEMFFRHLERLSNSSISLASEIIYHSISRGWKAPYPINSSNETGNSNDGNKSNNDRSKYRTDVSKKLDALFE